MKLTKYKTGPRKNRTCWDKLRAQILEARRRRRNDPATSAATQLVALFTLIFGRMPLLPAGTVSAPYLPPSMSPRHARRIEIARRLGIPTRYVDVTLAHGTVPYPLLFDHVRRGGRSREDAMSVLRQKAPESCRDWLDHVETWGLWSSLLLCHVRGGVDEDTDVRLLKSTLAWLQDLNPGGSPPAPADAETAYTPGTGGNPSDISSGPDKPKTGRP